MLFDANWTHLLSGGGGAGIALGAVGVIKALSRGKLRISLGNGENGNGKAVASSGAKPVEFWEAKFDGLDLHAQAQTRILEQQTMIMQKHTELLTELVTVSRMKTVGGV